MSNEKIIEILRFTGIGLAIIGFIFGAIALRRMATEDKRRVARAIKSDHKINGLKWEIELREREIAGEIMGEDGCDEHSDG